MRKVAFGEPVYVYPNVAQKRGLDLGLKERWTLDIGKNFRASSWRCAVSVRPLGSLVSLVPRVWARKGVFCSRSRKPCLALAPQR